MIVALRGIISVFIFSAFPRCICGDISTIKVLFKGAVVKQELGLNLEGFKSMTTKSELRVRASLTLALQTAEPGSQLIWICTFCH